MNQIDDHVKVRQRKSNRSTQDGDWQESGKRNKKRQNKSLFGHKSAPLGRIRSSTSHAIQGPNDDDV